MKADLCDVHCVDGDLPSCSLQKTEQAKGHGGLSCTGPTHNANLQTNTGYFEITSRRYANIKVNISISKFVP